MDHLLSQVGAGATLGSLYALIAVAANLSYRAAGIVNFAQGPAMLAAAALTIVLVRWFALPGPLAALASLALLVGVLVLTEAVIARPAQREAGRLGWVLATLGIGIGLQGAAALILEPGPITVPDALFGLHLEWRPPAIAAIAVAAIAATGIPTRIVWPGAALRANVTSAVLAMLAGLLMAQLGTPIQPGFGLNSLGMGSLGMGFMGMGFLAALLGGLGSTRGGIAGGLLVGMGETLAGATASASAHAILLGLAILILIFRPQGLFGVPEAARR